MSGLRLRLAITHLVLVIAALSALGVWVLGRVANDFENSLAGDLLSDARIIGNSMAPLIASGANSAALDAAIKETSHGTGTRVTLIALDGTVLADSDAEPATMENHADRPEVQAALRSGSGRSNRESATLNRFFVYAAARFDVPGGGSLIVRTARPSEAISTLVGEMRRSLIVAVVALSVLAVVLSGLLSRSILLPLARIGRATAMIAAGDYAARVESRPSGEVGELVDAFNRMAATVQQQMAAAAQERQRLAAALDSSVDAVLAVDLQSQVLYANLAAERLFQRPADEIVGHPFAWTLPNDEIVEAIRHSGERTESQATLIERPGHQHLQVVTAPIRGGGEWAVLVVFNDITDVRRTEQVRRDFVANVGHELRTPLAAIKSVVETLADGAIDDREVALDFLARADDEVDRLVQMVEELLELSRIESGDVPLNLEGTDIAVLLADIVRRLQPTTERKGLQLSLEVDTEVGIVVVDARGIDHAVTNLVHNATKFTPEGGSVRVHASMAPDALVISVSDTGIGIAPADLRRIFERFYKADQSRASIGSGLGLAVVKHTVEAHGGSVRAESRLGRGSTFTMTIPTRAA